MSSITITIKAKVPLPANAAHAAKLGMRVSKTVAEASEIMESLGVKVSTEIEADARGAVPAAARAPKPRGRPRIARSTEEPRPTVIIDPLALEEAARVAEVD